MYFLKKYRRGIKNKYRRGMPVSEMLLKDLNHWFWEAKNYCRNGMKHRTMLVYPHYPSRGSTLYKILRLLGYNITNKLSAKFDMAVYWEYLTFREEFQELEKIAKNGRKVINLYSRDISKEFVEEKFREIFSYGTFLDPTKYKGLCVKKNNINAKHDGEVILCPIEQTDKNFIYQILIDNQIDETQVEDIRLPVVNRTLPFAYQKFKPLAERFKFPTKSVLKPIEELLSPDEIEKTDRLCRALQLEFGEIDVLRNRTDGKIYVIDVNNTPQFQRNLSPEEKKSGIEHIARHFAERLLK